VPVVIHDRTVDRTTDGTGYVWERTADEVRALDAGSWFSPAYAGVRVPLLSEALDVLAPPDAGTPPTVAAPPLPPQLLLEIKAPADAEQVKRILAQVAERDLLDRTVVQSFDPGVVAVVRETFPEVRRGLLRLRIDADTVPLATGLGVVCCNPPVGDVLADPGTVAALTAAGIDIMPWTANDLSQWPALVAAGVAGLITDRTGELTGWAS
jgi:glycerophosphoryl diester phosphodiesterase